MSDSQKIPLYNVLNSINLGIIFKQDHYENYRIAFNLHHAAENGQKVFIVVEDNDLDKLNYLIDTENKLGNKIKAIFYNELNSISELGNVLIIFDSLTRLINENSITPELIQRLLKNNDNILVVQDYNSILTNEESDNDFSKIQDKFEIPIVFFTPSYLSTNITNKMHFNCNCISIYNKENKLNEYGISLNTYYKMNDSILGNINTNLFLSDMKIDKNNEIFNYFRFTNVKYPYNVEKILNQSDFENQIGLTNLIKTFGIGEIYKYAPKIKKLIDNIIIDCFNKTCQEDNRKKHVIFTAFDDYHGSKFIKGIFDYLDEGIENIELSTKNKFNCVILDNPDNESEILESWNSEDSENNVLIITYDTNTKIDNVDYFHMIDIFFKDGYDLFQKCFINNKGRLNDIFIYSIEDIFNKQNGPSKVNFEIFTQMYLPEIIMDRVRFLVNSYLIVNDEGFKIDLTTYGKTNLNNMAINEKSKLNYSYKK
jgi:hypothetical protein